MLALKEEWANHPKILKAVFLTDPAVKHFWFEAISASSVAGTDGVIEIYRLPLVAQSCGIDMATARAYLEALIAASVRVGGAGLFHDHASLQKCEACMEMMDEQGHEPGPDDIVVHDYLDHNPAKRNRTPVGKKREKRKNDLAGRSSWVKVAVYERDRGLCRYCGHRPNPDTKFTPESLEYDHVDPACFTPNHGNFVDGIVVSCRACNRHKSERTPDEAGMPLLGAGLTARDVMEGRGAYVDTPAEVAPPRNVEVGRAGSDRAAGRGGAGSAQAAGRVGAGSGQGRPSKGRGRQGRGGSGAASSRQGPRPRGQPP